MGQHHERYLGEDLHEVEALLRAARPTFTEIELGRLKLRALLASRQLLGDSGPPGWRYELNFHVAERPPQSGSPPYRASYRRRTSGPGDRSSNR